MIHRYTAYRLRQSNVIIVLFCSSLVLAFILLLAFQAARSNVHIPEQDFSSIRIPAYEPNSVTFQVEIDTSNFSPNIVPVDLSDGRVSSEFGMRIHPVSGKFCMHTGIDLAVDTGTPVVAAADGRVSFAAKRGGYGNLVIIDHLNEFTTRYAHLSKIMVGEGDFVRRGDTVGLVGMTGVVTGPHLHYEVRINGEEQNPREFLPEHFEKIAKEKQKTLDTGGN